MNSLWTKDPLISSVVTCSIILGCYLYYKNRYTYWAKLGLKGTAPVPLVGELYTLLFRNKMELEMGRLKKYGKVCGAFFAGKGRVLIADPEVVRQICIKDFDVFPNHDLNSYANTYQKLFLVWLRDEHWKKVRTLMSPTFTSGKIKRMFTFLDGCADDLIQLFSKHWEKGGRDAKGVVVNVKDAFQMFSMDGIATCCYGIKLRREDDSSNLKATITRDDFVRHASLIFERNLIRMACLLLTPSKILKLFGFQLTPDTNFEPLTKRVKELVKKRRQDPKKYDDLLQSLIEAKEGDQLELSELDKAENHHAGLTQEMMLEDQDKMVNEVKKNDFSTTSRTKLSEMEILSEATFMLAAGLETTSTLLTNLSYTLAFHQKIQEKLYEELKSIATFDPDTKSYKFDYDTLTTCHYLDAVISETLRILPPAPYTDRVASRDYYIEKYNITIPEGTSILLGIYAVQNDPENWYKPGKFDPDRFLPGNKEKIVPGSYMPFSMGPRHCIGMRFSLTETKLGLAKVLMRFRFEPAPGLKFPPTPSISPGLTMLKDPMVRIVKRDQ